MRTLMSNRFNQVLVLVSLLWVTGMALSFAVPGSFVGTVSAAEKVAGKMNANPCAPNPCAAKANPCAAKANPCAAKANPCAAKANPCAAKANPCAAKANPCAAKVNPCAAKKS